MKKIKKINQKNIKNILKNHLTDDVFLPEHRIDSIIKEYLLERNENTIYDDKYEFSPKSLEILSQSLDNLSDIKDDLEVIKEKEADVLILTDVYCDDYVNNVVGNLEKVIKDIEYMINISNQNKL